ncbi:H-NS histone family protein [Solimonas flava]|uniref:H-NS histone family protein n=1 Tax=Solimonas flava TaxID=415849 RepID=UPI0004005EA3|nr:H-NS histone family protein [Solimonas flava]
MSTPTYSDLLKQIESLTRQAEELRHQEITTVIAEIKDKMAQYGISAADLELDTKPAKRARRTGKVAEKYRNPATGESWTGRGRTPKWLAEAEAAGKSRDQFAV